MGFVVFFSLKITNLLKQMFFNDSKTIKLIHQKVPGPRYFLKIVLVLLFSSKDQYRGFFRNYCAYLCYYYTKYHSALKILPDDCKVENMLEYELDELQQNLYWSTSIMEGNKFAPGFSQLQYCKSP